MDPQLAMEQAFSRRGILKLGAAAGVAAGGAALGIPVTASAATGSGAASGVSEHAPIDASRFTPITANWRGSAVSWSDFIAMNGYSVYPGGAVYCNAAGPLSGNPFMVAPLDVPVGATLTAVTGISNSNAGTTWTLYAYNMLTSAIPSIFSGTSPSGSAQFVNLTGTPYTVPIYTRLILQGYPSADTNNTLIGAAYWYQPASPGFHAITPARVYDSRSSGGQIAAGATRVISVATALVGGATVVPASASAVLFNLTVTNTAAGGYLALFPYGTTWPGNSSINYTGAGQTVANAGVVTLGGDRQVNVYDGTGGGATDFIVDITGYYL